ncbi:MAG: class I SAM-dependent methyltransferase [Bacteroidetes bacterium]|nr:class I SAM-dependent methyltransferase [Bacteroidota bacterium]
MSEKILRCPVCEKSVFSPFLEVNDHFLSKEDFTIQQCEGCGFKFVNPRPDTDEIGRYYQSDDYISHDAKKADIISLIYKFARVLSVRNKYSIVHQYASHGKILDIGCGTGEFLKYCKSKGFDVTGIEPNEKAGDFAEKKNGIPILRSLTDLNSGKGSFACITMWHVLEHVHDLNETIETVKGLLQADGVFIVAVPNYKSWDAQEYGKFWAAYDVPRHLYHFNDSTMNQLVEKHGFKIHKTIPQKLDAFYVSMLSEKYRSGANHHFKAMVNGFKSNFHAKGQGRGYSSQIFVFTTKKA